MYIPVHASWHMMACHGTFRFGSGSSLEADGRFTGKLGLIDELELRLDTFLFFLLWLLLWLLLGLALVSVDDSSDSTSPQESIVLHIDDIIIISTSYCDITTPTAVVVGINRKIAESAITGVTGRISASSALKQSKRQLLQEHGMSLYSCFIRVQ